MKSKVSYGWIFLTNIFEFNHIYLLTDDFNFSLFMKHIFKNKLCKAVPIKKNSCLVINLHKRNDSITNKIDLEKFNMIFIVSKNSSFCPLTKFFIIYFMRKFGVNSKTNIVPRDKNKLLRKLIIQKKHLSANYLFFPNYELCTHIVNLDDDVGIKLFFSEILRIKKLGAFLSLMPLCLKKAIINVSSQQKLLVFENG